MYIVDNSNTPPFLGKLWKMVNNPDTDHLISWNQTGDSFIIQNQAQFWYELLPLYYKHNNMSSFVRQLNMYGFHKLSTVDNGSMDADKEEMQFFHPCFQKNQPEKLKNIKRKGTNAKTFENQSVLGQDNLDKVLTDVKQIRGRQSNVDSQLSAMKQENAVLWKELALLRHKHIKQQQIVNKLIQFLVTLVQPTTPTRMGVGGKRRIPLMLRESSSKRLRTKKNSIDCQSTDGGPTIHELDNEFDNSSQQILQEGSKLPLEDSPVTTITPVVPQSSSKAISSVVRNENAVVRNENDRSTQAHSIPSWDKPEFVDLTDLYDSEEDLINAFQNNVEPNDKIFINPDNRDALISNLTNCELPNINDVKNTSPSKEQPKGKAISNASAVTQDTQIATNDQVKINSGNDLDHHLSNTRNELDQLKDILNGYDASTLLDFFSDEHE